MEQQNAVPKIKIPHNSKENMSDEINLKSLYEYSIEVWRIEEQCRLKLKSIEEINNSSKQVAIENEWLEKQLNDTKQKIEEVRDTIVSFDRITMCLNETIAHLEVQYKNRIFSIDKSRNDHELQLFIRLELFHKDEERLNSIPEVKSLKTAETELQNTKLEYEELLINYKNLETEVAKAKDENVKKLNDSVIIFAKAYVEMVSVNKREEHCRTLLRELDVEYLEKLNMKNALLKSKKNAFNKVSYWTNTLSPLNLNVMDVKYDLSTKDLKSYLKYSNDQPKLDIVPIENSKFEKPQKNVTFLLPNEDEVSMLESNSEMEIELLNNVNPNSLTKKNIGKANVPPNQFSNKVSISEPIKINLDDRSERNNGIDLGFQTKHKTINLPSKVIKKPYNSVKDGILKLNTNLRSLESVQSNVTNENICIKSKINENEENVESLNKFEMVGFEIENNIQEKSSVNDKLNLMTSDSDDINVFNDLSQIDQTQSHKQNKALSSLFWKDGVKEFEVDNSQNSSCCGLSDISDLLENTLNDVSEYPNTQMNFMNAFKSNSANSNFKTNNQELEVKNSQQTDNMFQLFKNESFVNMNTSRNPQMSSSTSKGLNDFISDQFKFNFN